MMVKYTLGLGNVAGDGRVYYWDESNIVLVKQFNPVTVEQVECLHDYNSKLYAGLGRDNSSGAVWMLDS